MFITFTPIVREDLVLTEDAQSIRVVLATRLSVTNIVTCLQVAENLKSKDMYK